MMTMDTLSAFQSMPTAGTATRHHSLSSTSYFEPPSPTLPLMTQEDDSVRSDASLTTMPFPGSLGVSSNSSCPDMMDGSGHDDHHTSQSSTSQEQQQISSTTAMLECLTATVTPTPSQRQHLPPPPPSKLFNRQLQSRVHLMVFVKILLQYLDRVDAIASTSSDTSVNGGLTFAMKAKLTVAECHARHAGGEKAYQNLPIILESKLREAIGEFHFTKAQSIHRQAQFRAKRKASWSNAGSLINPGSCSLGAPTSSSSTRTSINNARQRQVHNLLSHPVGGGRGGGGACSKLGLPPRPQLFIQRDNTTMAPPSHCVGTVPSPLSGEDCSTVMSALATRTPSETVAETQTPSPISASYKVQKKYNTASGLPPCFQLRDAQFLKNQPSEQRNSCWAPNLEELNHLMPGMKVQCTIVKTISGDDDVNMKMGPVAAQQEAIWMTIQKVIRKRTTGPAADVGGPAGTGTRTRIRRVLVASVVEDSSSSPHICDLPANSTILLLPKHVQRVERRSADVLFERAQAQAQAQAASPKNIGCGSRQKWM